MTFILNTQQTGRAAVFWVLSCFVTIGIIEGSRNRRLSRPGFRWVLLQVSLSTKHNKDLSKPCCGVFNDTDVSRKPPIDRRLKVISFFCSLIVQEDESLQSLSQEEQECLQFFEQTIDSLEESLEEDDRVGFTMSPNLNRPPSPKEQDIIDLVRPEPDLMQTREPVSKKLSKNIKKITQQTEDTCLTRDPSDSLPSEYNPPLPSGSFGSTDSSYHPPGCIPTPVLIAQKIAENQAGGNSSNLLPSTRLRRLSLESEKPADYSTDPPAKQGPPTSTKPARFPSNISVILSNKEHQNQSLANVNIHERRAQMLANLSGTSHPLLQENSQPAEEQKPRNTPTRSISFRDPTPGNSHIDTTQSLPAKPEPIELNSYGGKSRAINPTTGPTRPPETPVKTYKPPAPTPAPRPPRLSYHGALSSQKAASRALSPDHKRRSNSMFRPQGITVQFSGRGATNESRREALRKLGLLKDS
uniref:Proline and serine rich 2 n=1 Tax=Acanthochromis polyacanthus TaxID=80966 RepID=A0A3Q1GQN5_9TELE